MALDTTIVNDVLDFLNDHDEDDEWGCERAARKLKKGNPTEAIDCLEAFQASEEHFLSIEEKYGTDIGNDLEILRLQLRIDKFKSWITALKK